MPVSSKIKILERYVRDLEILTTIYSVKDYRGYADYLIGMAWGVVNEN